MHDAFQLRNRIFAVVTIAAMVLGSLSAVLAPSTVSAATAGDLIKNESLSTVYYYAPDGTRYAFPNEKTYFTWYSDFSGVETISDSALADIALGGNIVYRPGSYWVKITSNPKVYAVSTDGTILWIEDAATAEAYAGSDWATQIHDVADVFWSDYSEGVSLTSATAYDGMMYMDGSDYYLAWGGEKRMVSSAGRTANKMQTAMFLNGTGIDDSALTAGSEITSAVAELTDASQQGGVEDVVATGDVTVKLSSSNPAGASVPTNANTVEVLKIDLKAGSEATEVDQIAVKMIGLSSTTDVSNVYLYEGDSRITEARSVNSSTRKATFGSLNLALAANETRTISVRVTIAGSAGDEIQFGVYAAEDIDATGDVSGSFPISGNTFEVSGTTVGTVTIIDTGSVSNPSLGGNDSEIGSFKVTTATEAGYVQSLTVKIDNASDHSDYKMWADDEVVATGEYIGDKLVVFAFDEEHYISKGGNEIFTVSADIGGEAADTIRMYMDNAIDVMVEGAEYFFPMAATITGYDGSACTTDGDECNYSTIQGGDITFDTSGPTSGDIRTNSQDQVLLEFTIKSLQNITVKDLDIIVVADDDDNDPFDKTDDDAANADGDADGLVNTDTEANITDIRIINTVTGDTLMGPLELDALTDAAAADDADQTIDFTDDFEMEAGETLYLAVLADVDDTITSGTELGAIIDISGFVAEDVNGDTIASTSVVPSSDMYEGAQRAVSASLVVTLSSTPGDVTTVHGMEDVTVGKFNFTAGDAGEVNISSITADVYLHDVATGDFSQAGNCTAAECAVIGAVVTVTDYLETCSIYNKDGELLDGPKSPSSSGSLLVFDDMSWTIDAGESEVLDLHCNFSNPVLATTVYFAFDLDDLSEIILAEDEEGTDIDPTTDSPNGDYSTPTNVVTLASAGSLAVAVDSGTPTEDFILTGTTMNEVSSFRFTATNEDFEITTLTVAEQQAEQDDADGDGDVTGDPDTYSNNISLVTLSYPLADGTTGTKTATMNSAEAKFSLSSAPLYVATGDPATVDVFVNVPATSRNVGGAATSGEKMMFDIFVDTANDDNFKAVGVGSDTSLDDDDLSATSTDPYTFVVKETKPTVSLSSSSPSGTKVPGDQEVFRFNVAASSNEDVVISELIWKISSTDNAGSTWNYCDTTPSMAGVFDEPIMDLYNLSTTGTGTPIDDDAEWTFFDGDMSVCTENTDSVDYAGLTFSSTAEYIVVPAGTTYTFALYMDSTGASATNDDAIQVSLMGDPILESSSFLAASDLNEANLTAIDTTLTVTTSAGYTAGDILCMDTADDACADADEKMLLITVTDGTTIEVIRGYLGTEPDATSANDAGDDIDRMPSGFVWEDDGDAATANSGEDWGGYLVDSLPVSGYAISF